MQIIGKLMLFLLLLFFGLLTWGAGACLLPGLGRESLGNALVALIIVAILAGICWLILRALISPFVKSDPPDEDPS